MRRASRPLGGTLLIAGGVAVVAWAWRDLGVGRTRATGHRVAEATDVAVRRSRGLEEVALQACNPRFFAGHRYIVYARPIDR